MEEKYITSSHWWVLTSAVWFVLLLMLSIVAVTVFDFAQMKPHIEIEGTGVLCANGLLWMFHEISQARGHIIRKRA